MVMQQAVECLDRFEAELRALVSQAARDGNYNDVLTLTHWAQALTALKAEQSVQTASGAIPRTAVPTSPVKARKKYPVFTRTSDALIKIGWAAKSRSEYEHRAPLDLVRKLANAAQQVGARGRLFQLDALARAAHGDAATPGYQLYVVVAWWRDIGLLDQHGRKGYSTGRAATFAADVEQAFTRLTARKD